MNAIARIAAVTLSLAAAGSAFADDITIDTTVHQSLKSRAQVAQELAQFKQGVNPWASSYNLFAQHKSTRDRAAVVAETRAAIASGEIAAFAGEDSGSAYLAAHSRPAKGNPLVLAGR